MEAGCFNCGLSEADCICDDGRDDEEYLDSWDCAFGEACCMPGPHTRDECHTAEMAEEYMSAEVE
jgi:hypothetical protein